MSYPIEQWEQESSSWFQVRHSGFEITTLLKPHEAAVLSEQQSLIEAYSNEPDCLQEFFVADAVQHDSLHQSANHWAITLQTKAHALYQRHPMSKHIYRVMVNATMVPIILARIPEERAEHPFDIEADLRNYCLAMVIIRKIIESGIALNNRRLVSKPHHKEWNALIRQAETIMEEISERIFGLHCKLASVRKK